MKLLIGKLKFLYLVCFKFFEIFFDKGLKFKSMMLPESSSIKTHQKMYAVAGLNAEQITKKILDFFFNKETIKVIK